MKTGLTILIIFFSTCCLFAQQAKEGFIFEFYNKQKLNHSENIQLSYQMQYGASHFVSLIYDKRFKANQTNGLGFQVGISSWFNNQISLVKYKDNKEGTNYDNVYRYNRVYGLPIGLNYLFGKDKHHFEIGVTAAFSLMFGDEFRVINGQEQNKSKYRFFVLPNPSLGYRFQSKNQHFVGHFLLKLIPVGYFYAFFPLEIGGGYKF